MKNILIVLIIGFFSNFGYSQLEFADEIVKVNFTVEQNKTEAYIVANVKVRELWHINASVLPQGSFGLPTTFNLNSSKNFEVVGGIIEPKPIEKYDELADENLAYHEGSFKMKRKIKVLSNEDFKISGEFNFQTCNAVKCLPDYTYEFTITVKGVQVEKKETTPKKAMLPTTDLNNKKSNSNDKLAKNNDETTNKAEIQSTTEKTEQATIDKVKTTEDIVSKSSIWTIFWLSFASGLLALLTPCVFPMIPMTVSYFTKNSKSKAQGVRNASIYGISIILIYVLFGALVMATGKASKLNEMSTNPWFNIGFFVLLVVFAVSFMGAFEIRMPSSWINKADAKADKGGLIGIFFMALVLALVSFSCTGPIVGPLLVEAASNGGIAPIVGMFAFGLALALPFALFAAFPGWLNSMPQSGGWLNTVKVFLGVLELALAFKFLSNADLAWQSHWLEREVFLAIWIAIFGFLAMYLFGKITLPHDSKVERIGVGRAILGIFTLSFVIYMIPGLWGADLKIISAFPPPKHYSESPLGVGRVGGNAEIKAGPEGTHLGPQNIYVFDDLEKAQAHAKKINKPLFIDFTGHNCVNCRKMEQSVWGEPGVIEILRDEVVVVSLHVDERTKLPKEEQISVTYPNGKIVKLETVGDKWTAKQVIDYRTTSQPYYVMKTPDGEDINIGSASYQTHNEPSVFKSWLEKGLKKAN